MTRFVPENLDIDNLLPDTLTGDERDRFHDRIAYFCDILIVALKNKKTFDKFISTGFIQLMKLYLRNIMQDQTDDVIEVLEHAGVIRVNRSFIIGEKAMGYVFTEKYRLSSIKHVMLRSYQVKKTLRVYQWEFEREQQKLRTKIPNVISQLTNNQWQFDIASATEWIESFEKTLYHAITKSPLIPEKYKEDVISKYHHYYQFVREQIHLIKNGVWSANIDDKSGRLHTNITSLPRPLKYFISLHDGESLVGLDIKNSQPFLMGYVAQKNFWSTSTDSRDKTIKLMRVEPRLHKRIMEQYRDERREIIKMMELAETQSGTGFEQLNFISLVREGRFYEEIQSKFEGQFLYKGKDRFGSRDLTKAETLRIMYFDTRKENLPFYAPFKLFAELFPLEAQIMRLLKCDDYTQFPILLQKIESKLILEELGRELHDTPFLTLHDSLIFRSHCEDQVVTVLNKVFTRHLQTVPRLERTVYTPSRAFEMLPNYLEEKLMKLELKFGSNRNDSSVGSDAKHNK